MVRGNTTTGIYPPPKAKVLIDISRVPELTKVTVTQSQIVIGGAATITDLMVVLENNIDLSPTFPPLLAHLQRVSRITCVVHLQLNIMSALSLVRVYDSCVDAGASEGTRADVNHSLLRLLK